MGEAHQWEYGSLGADMCRHRACKRCRLQARTWMNGAWDDADMLEWQSITERGWNTGELPECFDPATLPRGTEWERAEDEHPRWEIRNPKGDGCNFLCTDAVIRTFGRKHVEKLLRGLPPLPDKAWEADEP